MPNDEPSPARHNTDPRTIRALAHPLRLRILDLLSEHGPQTASQLSERVGESPANCSFHLRTLARYGYVEDAGGGTGRNRPWKLVSRETYWNPVDADPETAAAMASAQTEIDAVNQERLRIWRRRSATAPRAWREHSTEMDFDTWLTPEEMGEVSREIATVLKRVVQNRPKRPGSARVLIHTTVFPISEELPDLPQPEEGDR